MKYLYILFGLLGVALGIFVTYCWIENGVIYTLSHLIVKGQNFTSITTLFLFFMFWIHGIIYLWYGVKPQRINKWSNSTFIIFILMMITIMISGWGVGPCYIGGSCPQPLISDRLIYACALLLSSIALLISLFKKPKSNEVSL